MKQQVAKLLYVWLVRFFSLLYKKLPLKKRLVYLMSFTNNENGLLKTFMKQEPDINIVIFYTENCREEAKKFQQLGAKAYLLNQSPLLIKRTILELSQSPVILCDNYFPILAGFSPHLGTTIIQLWHANGAIKCFGLEDQSLVSRTSLDKKRFKQVYKRFDEYIVGSKMMGEVFQRSYLAKEENILYLGFPRTDVYFDKEQLKKNRNNIYKKYPELKNKEILLYAPTYREDDTANYPLDLYKIHKALGNDYALLIKNHPHVSQIYTKKGLSKFLYDDLVEFNTEELLTITDCLITDYSSIPFDYTLLDNAKRVVFYCYDKKDYSKTTGIQKDFTDWAPGDIVCTVDGLLESIQKKDATNFIAFNQKWNTYNDGNATSRVIQHIISKYKAF